MSNNPHRARQTLTVLGVVGTAVAGALAIAQNVFSSLDLSFAANAITVLAVALAGAASARILASQQREAVLEGVLRHWPPVRVADADPHDLGVFAHVSARPYIDRDIEEELGKALTGNGLTLIHGPASSGKSHSDGSGGKASTGG